MTTTIVVLRLQHKTRQFCLPATYTLAMVLINLESVYVCQGCETIQLEIKPFLCFSLIKLKPNNRHKRKPHQNCTFILLLLKPIIIYTDKSR